VNVSVHHSKIDSRLAAAGSRRSDGQQGFADCPLCLQ